MKRPLIFAITFSVLYSLFLFNLTNKDIPPYKYNKAFFEDFYNKGLDKDVLVQIVKIKKNSEWLKNTKTQAKARGISVPEMLKINAKFIITQRKKNE